MVILSLLTKKTLEKKHFSLIKVKASNVWALLVGEVDFSASGLA